PAGRGRRADGDLRRDDRARAARPRRARRARALRRPTRPCARRAAAAGGRGAELVEAARRIVESGVDPAEIDENVFAANLYAPELPDPDLLVRTSGEQRLSNFLLWQLA